MTSGPPPAQGRGAWAEDLALAHLRDAGLRLETRNYRCPRGEIDLVMRDGEVVVFVEVRYRTGGWFGGGVESVDAGKRTRLRATASHYLRAHPAAATLPCRFDLVAIGPGAGGPAVQWIANAFEG